MHASSAQALVARFAAEGAGIRILYGGSVKPSNARELLVVERCQRCAGRRREPQGTRLPGYHRCLWNLTARHGVESRQLMLEFDQSTT